MWDMRRGRASQDDGEPTTNRGFPGQLRFPPSPTSPPPFYAPNGPGPFMSAHGPGSAKPGTKTPLPSYPGYRPEHHSHEHRNYQKQKHRQGNFQSAEQGGGQEADPFPQFVNQGPHKAASANPSFMNPRMTNSGYRPSKHANERKRSDSQGHSQGYSSGFNTDQSTPQFGFPSSDFGDARSAQDNAHHAHNRSRSQGRSQGYNPGLNVNQGSSNPGFPSPDFGDSSSTQDNVDYARNRSHSQGRSQGYSPGINVNQGSSNPSFRSHDFGQPRSTQENTRRERNRANSQGRSPDFLNQGSSNRGLPSPGFGQPTLTQGNARHERNRANSQGRSTGRSVDFDFNQDSPDSDFPHANFGGPRSMQEFSRSGRDRTHSQRQRPGMNDRGTPKTGFSMPDFEDPSSNRSDPRHERRRTRSQGRNPGGIPNPAFPNLAFGDPDAMNSGDPYFAEGNTHHHRSRTYSQGHNPGYNEGGGRDHRPDHGRYRSQSRDRRRAGKLIAPDRPFMTSTSHVVPSRIPSPSPSQQPRQLAQQHKMPPLEPRHMHSRGVPGSAHDISQVFQYSRCTGRKKALCIGINYQGQENDLRGCVRDAKNVRKFLITRWGYKTEDVVILADDARHERQLPTRKNMIEAMHWLVQGAKSHDALFFHFSGHGGQTKDLNGDEIDGFDEVIYPLDYARAGHIVDDELHAILVKSLPQGCRLTALFDSCHSGTALDLAYVYHSNGRLRGNQVSPRARMAKSTPADVISWCACRDDQTSADTTNQAGEAVGAMSYAFMYSLKGNPNQSYLQLLRSVREILRKEYSQKSQLSSSHPIDIDLRFVM